MQHSQTKFTFQYSTFHFTDHCWSNATLSNKVHISIFNISFYWPLLEQCNTLKQSSHFNIQHFILLTTAGAMQHSQTKFTFQYSTFHFTDHCWSNATLSNKVHISIFNISFYWPLLEQCNTLKQSSHFNIQHFILLTTAGAMQSTGTNQTITWTRRKTV